MKKDFPPLFSSNETANLEGRFIGEAVFQTHYKYHIF